MSAVCLFILILCLYGTAWTAADGETVVWRNVGKQVTIQCRTTPNQEYLYLKRGLNEEEVIYFTDSHKTTINQKFTDRLQFHGTFPNVDILLKNLTLEDTGPYWCVYRKTDESLSVKTTRGTGSVLLVVTENRPSPTVPEREQSQGDFLLVFLLRCAAVLVVVLTGCLILLILKNKRLQNNGRTRRDESI